MRINANHAAAWATTHETPMLFPSENEAALHCDENENPVALIAENNQALMDLISSTKELIDAAFARDISMGDPINLIVARSNLDEKTKAARLALARLTTPQATPRTTSAASTAPTGA